VVDEPLNQEVGALFSANPQYTVYRLKPILRFCRIHIRQAIVFGHRSPSKRRRGRTADAQKPSVTT
jgi:hypothetical protein